MSVTLLQGCTVVPSPGQSPIYSFKDYTITSATLRGSTTWAVFFKSFAASDMAEHFAEQSDEVGFIGAYVTDKSGMVCFSSSTPAPIATVLLASALASDVIGAASSYWEAMEEIDY